MAKKKESVKAEEAAAVEESASVALSEDSGVAEKVEEPDVELVEELIRYEFNDAEMVDMAGLIGDFMYRIDRLTSEKKSAVSGYDSEIKKATLDLEELAQNIRDKFEMRRVSCYCIKDFKAKKAVYFRADQHSLDHLIFLSELPEGIVFVGENMDDGPVKIRDLKHWELQRELEFTEKEKRGEDEDEIDVESRKAETS